MPAHPPKTPESDIEVDLTKVPSPPLAGFANGCSLTEFNEFVEFAFLETSYNRQIPVARLIMSVEDVVLGLWPRTEAFYEALQTATDRPRWGSYPVLDGNPVPPSAPAPQCSILSLARRGQTCQLEAYYLPHISVYRKTVDPKSKLQVVPLLSVQLPTGLIFSILTELAPKIQPWTTQLAQSLTAPQR